MNRRPILAAFAGAVGGLLLGRHIDAGHGRRAVWLAIGSVAAVTILRAFSTDVPAMAVIAAGYDVVLATPNGTKLPIDEASDAAQHFEGDEAAYARADVDRREQIVEAFASAHLSGGAWEHVDVSRAWSVVTRDALGAFYAHPWSWNEIGFGGPAYPRGYARMGVGLSEAWEGQEAIHPDPVPDVKRKGFE